MTGMLSMTSAHDVTMRSEAGAEQLGETAVQGGGAEQRPALHAAFSDLVRSMLPAGGVAVTVRAQGHPRPFGTSTQNAYAHATSENHGAVTAEVRPCPGQSRL